ncbi:MAG: hypothetical protein CVU63_12805, partial [Deltaproteobacteria bacterium HGW-Deltaproteobacteria-20]
MTRTRLRTLTTLASMAVLCATAHEARAQAGTTEYAASDVLLLLDTSGSMAYTTVREPEDPSRYGLPRCGPSGAKYPTTGSVSFDGGASFASGASPADRWAILVNAFTGEIEGPQCAAQDRSDLAFSQEFGLGTSPSSSAAPYDKGYYLPFNRIVATRTVGTATKRCTPAPSWHTDVRSMTNAMEWPDVAPVYWRDMDAGFDPGVPCPFDPQDTNGIIDRLQSAVRFGVMTFDSTPRRTDTGGIGTGMTSSFAPDYPSGIADTWSYFAGWITSTGSAATGWPNDCAPPTNNLRLYEVGARNPAAPPWEGRLIGFGDPQATTEEMIVHNERVQQAILGMRPFGGTPVAGMLADAYYFMTQDATTPANVGNASFYGGKVDNNVWMDDRTKRGCRRRIAILITDGGPNLDLQPHCDPLLAATPPGNGKCPYRTPAQLADDLYQHNIDLFVVGFSVTATSGTGAGASTLTCGELMDPAKPLTYKSCITDLAPCNSTCGANKCAYGYCVTTPEKELLAVCCNLESIANAGSRYTSADVGKTPGTGRSAYWAE